MQFDFDFIGFKLINKKKPLEPIASFELMFMRVVLETQKKFMKVNLKIEDLLVKYFEMCD